MQQVLDNIIPNLSLFIFVRKDGKPYTSKKLEEHDALRTELLFISHEHTKTLIFRYMNIMTCSNQYTQFGEILELVAEKGLNGISEPVTLLLNLAMRLEREQYLQVESYERT